MTTIDIVNNQWYFDDSSVNHMGAKMLDIITFTVVGIALIAGIGHLNRGILTDQKQWVTLVQGVKRGAVNFSQPFIKMLR